MAVGLNAMKSLINYEISNFKCISLQFLNSLNRSLSEVVVNLAEMSVNIRLGKSLTAVK